MDGTAKQMVYARLLHVFSQQGLNMKNMTLEEKLKHLDSLYYSLPASARNELDQLANKRDASKPPYNRKTEDDCKE